MRERLIRVFAIIGLSILTPAEALAINWIYDTNNNSLRSQIERNPDELALEGQTVFKFSIEHGGCGGDENWNDCVNDRQRVELKSGYHISLQNFGSKSKKTRKHYQVKLYIPSEEAFPNLYPMLQMIHQVKLHEKNNPIWSVYSEYSGLRIRTDSRGICLIKREFVPREEWLSIDIFADYTIADSNIPKSIDKDNPAFEYKINGKSVCKIYQPLVTKQALKDGGRRALQLKFGIYNTFASRWLLGQDENKAWVKENNITFGGYQQNTKGQSNGAVSSTLGKPFDYNWPVKLPTQTIYYSDWIISNF